MVATVTPMNPTAEAGIGSRTRARMTAAKRAGYRQAAASSPAGRGAGLRTGEKRRGAADRQDDLAVSLLIRFALRDPCPTRPETVPVYALGIAKQAVRVIAPCRMP